MGKNSPRYSLSMDRSILPWAICAKFWSMSWMYFFSSLLVSWMEATSQDAEGQLKVCSEKMGALSTAIANISESSLQINGIIKTIEDISIPSVSWRRVSACCSADSAMWSTRSVDCRALDTTFRRAASVSLGEVGEGQNSCGGAVKILASTKPL